MGTEAHYQMSTTFQSHLHCLSFIDFFICTLRNFYTEIVPAKWQDTSALAVGYGNSSIQIFALDTTNKLKRLRLPDALDSLDKEAGTPALIIDFLLSTYLYQSVKCFDFRIR